MITRYEYLVKEDSWSKEETGKNPSMKVGHEQIKCFACYTAGRLWRGKWSPGLSAGGVTTFFAENVVAWAHMLDRSRKICAMTMILLKEEDFGCLLELRSRFRCSLLRSCPLSSIMLPPLMAASTSVSGGRAAV